MAEYIEREAAIRVVSGQSSFTMTRSSLIDSISNIPAADVAPVVRCKDCKYRYSDSWCEYVDDDDNFYCARGERKEGADNEP